MAEGEGNLGQQHRNISAVDVLETSRQTRIELTNILESILRQLRSGNAGNSNSNMAEVEGNLSQHRAVSLLQEATRLIREYLG